MGKNTFACLDYESRDPFSAVNAFELCAIVSIYTFWIIPRIARKTNSLFEKRMMNKTWDIPVMLEDYTAHLSEVFIEIIKNSCLKLSGAT